MNIYDVLSHLNFSQLYLLYMRWVQVTPGVTLQSYTFFKPLDLSRSNGQKNTLINAKILIRISLIIHHLLYFISISKLKKLLYLTLSLSLSLSLRFSLYLFLLHCYSTSMDRLPTEGCEAMVSHPCKSYIQKRNIYDERTFQHKPAIAANCKRKKVGKHH